MSDSTVIPRRPGGQMSSRPLHFIWLVDASGSMRVKGKMEALNRAIQGAVPFMQAVARENPQAAIFVNGIRFGDDARWLVERLTPVSDFRWHDIEAGGMTALGEALTVIGDALQPPLIRERSFPPILALVTDGLPTDDFQAGLSHLLARPWGRQAMRVVVGIGEDAVTPEARELFRAFLASDSVPPFQANDPETLAGHVRWISTAVVEAVCSPDLAVSKGRLGSAGVPVAGAKEADVW